MKRAAMLIAVLFMCWCGARAGAGMPTERKVEVVAHRFAFVPAEITVKRGEKIDLRVETLDVPHSLMVKQLNLRVDAFPSRPGEAVFVASRAGDYQGRCARFCGSGHGRMVFTIHVTD